MDQPEQNWKLISVAMTSKKGEFTNEINFVLIYVSRKNQPFNENSRRFPMVSYFLQNIFRISHTPSGLYVTRETEKITVKLVAAAGFEALPCQDLILTLEYEP